MSDLSDTEMKKMKENIAARRAARLAKETNGLAPTGDAGPVKADGNNGLASTGGAGPVKAPPHGKETQCPVGLWPASCNALMMIIGICMAFMSEAWSRGYIVPVLCFIWTVVRYPFVSMVWSGVYLAVSVACFAACSSSGPCGSNFTTSSEDRKMSSRSGSIPSMASRTSVDMTLDRPAGALMSSFPL